MIITRQQVNKERSAYRLNLGQGYVRLGKPRVPAAAVHPPSACEPASGGDGDTHMIVSPQNVQVIATWHAATKEWEPIGVSGRRVAFESRYLAAHGWTYGGLA